MLLSVLLILLHGITSNDHSTPVRRGNVFQQLGFLAGIPLNEQYYSMLLHIMYEESLENHKRVDCIPSQLPLQQNVS